MQTPAKRCAAFLAPPPSPSAAVCCAEGEGGRQGRQRIAWRAFASRASTAAVFFSCACNGRDRTGGRVVGAAAAATAARRAMATRRDG